MTKMQVLPVNLLASLLALTAQCATRGYKKTENRLVVISRSNAARTEPEEIEEPRQLALVNSFLPFATNYATKAVDFVKSIPSNKLFSYRNVRRPCQACPIDRAGLEMGSGNTKYPPPTTTANPYDKALEKWLVDSNVDNSTTYTVLDFHLSTFALTLGAFMGVALVSVCVYACVKKGICRGVIKQTSHSSRRSVASPRPEPRPYLDQVNLIQPLLNQLLPALQMQHQQPQVLPIHVEAPAYRLPVPARHYAVPPRYAPAFADPFAHTGARPKVPIPDSGRFVEEDVEAAMAAEAEAAANQACALPPENAMPPVTQAQARALPASRFLAN